ncbi:hypothetical protein [Paenibacillus taiwanensis]|nr:hypothetical protein [Paenibacillus taiwanensis]
MNKQSVHPTSTHTGSKKYEVWVVSFDNVNILERSGKPAFRKLISAVT